MSLIHKPSERKIKLFIKMEVDREELLLLSPFTLLCVGATSSGKTSFIKKFLIDVQNLVSQPPKKILYCYGTFQPIFEHMKEEVHNITFMQGIPNKQILEELSAYGQTLLIVDDLMNDVYNSKDMLHLFTQYSHHHKISVIFTTQNLYHGGKFGRTITLNCHYLVLFKNYNLAQVRFLGQSLFPHKSHKFIQIYNDAIQKKYGYLLIDLHPGSDSRFMLRTQIFPPEDMVIYQMDGFNFNN